jgi:hypothetical protein
MRGSRVNLSAGRAALRRLARWRTGALHLSSRRVLVHRRLISALRLRGSLSRRVRLTWSRALARRRWRLILLRLILLSRGGGRLARALVGRLAGRVLLLTRLLLARLSLASAGLSLPAR